MQQNVQASTHAMRHAKFYHLRVSKLAQLGGKTAELATLTAGVGDGSGKGSRGEGAAWRKAAGGRGDRPVTVARMPTRRVASETGAKQCDSAYICC